MANSSLTGFKHLDLSDQLYAGLMFIRLLGKSQFSVWEAKKITDKRRVAVKVFASRRGTGERQQDDEVKALIMLDSHESLIQYYDLLHQDVCVNHATGAIYKTIDDAKADGIDLDELDNAFLHFVVMELVKNGSLGEKYFEWSRDNRADSCFQLSRVADALCQVHRLGILHRDIKPANLFWDMNAGRVKIGDFGLAKSADSEFSPGGLTGTLAYLAPECWQSNDTPKRDVYAFAVTLYQIFTGKLPITVDSNEVLSHEAWELAHKNSERPHISLECEISYDLANAIMKAMSPELESRPEMDELRDALLKEHKRLAGKSTVPQASDYEAPAYLANKKWIVELPNFIVHPNVRTEILEEDAYWIEIHLAQESALKVMSIHEALQGSIGPFYQLAETWGHWSFAASFWHRRDDRVSWRSCGER